MSSSRRQLLDDFLEKYIGLTHQCSSSSVCVYLVWVGTAWPRGPSSERSRKCFLFGARSIYPVVFLSFFLFSFFIFSSNFEICQTQERLPFGPYAPYITYCVHAIELCQLVNHNFVTCTIHYASQFPENQINGWSSQNFATNHCLSFAFMLSCNLWQTSRRRKSALWTSL
jgi:hypothetical protein